jgi:hypothetical protein
MTNDVFERTWGERAGPRPAEDYWRQVIPAVTAEHPEFRFLAEAYWDLEWELQQQGFDACYDKRLYDRLAHEGAEDVRGHLTADPAYQDRLVRFIENHDEPRAAATFPPGRARVAAVAALTQTGTRLVHEGQLEGRRVRVPVFLARRPDEAPDEELRAFYERLLPAIGNGVGEGAWQLAELSGWPGEESWRNLVAWGWRTEAPRTLVVANLSGERAVGRVSLPWDDLRGRAWELADPTTDDRFERSGDELRDGLYVELGPWQWHLFRLTPQEA